MSILFDRPNTAVIVNDFCFPKGGASRVAIDEAIGLADFGVKVVYFGAVGPVDIDLYNNENITVICLNQLEIAEFANNWRVAVQGVWNFKAAYEMKRLLESLDPLTSIIHVHGYSKALTASFLRPIFLKKFHLIHTLHDYFDACPNGGFFNYKLLTPCEIQSLSIGCILSNCDKRSYVQKLYRVLKSITQKHIARWPVAVDNFIYLSATSLKYLSPYLPPSANYNFLPNMNNTVRRSPVNVSLNKFIIFVGQLDPHKGIARLLDAAKEAKVYIRFVGDGPLRHDIERDGHFVTGWLAKEQVHDEIINARVLVFPSLWYETYGLVVDEAAAIGVPSIVSDITVAADRVENGVSGWVYKADDIFHLARCLAESSNDNLIMAFGRAAYKNFWDSPLSYHAHTKGLIDIYSSILSARCRSD
jgi:glycosyltransferase involved in cell wall biosynthesis